MMKWLWGLLALGALALGAGLWSTPAVAAYLCPSCFGLVEVEAGIYAEPEAEDIRPLIKAARARVAEYYGAFDRQPVLLICQSAPCHARFGDGGARATTYGSTFIYISPRGVRVDIMAHEFSHIELHARIGLWGMMRGALPTWFDEGLAVLASQDQRYLGPEGKAVNCPEATALPESAKDWRRAAGHTAPTLYHDAACAAQTRLAEMGGLAAAMRF